MEARADSRISGKVILDAKDIQALGFSRTMVYGFFNRQDFPTVRIGSRCFVRRDRFFEWLDQQAEQERGAG